jgi:hypothetical protein
MNSTQQGGPPSIDQDLKKAINDHLIENSNIASNRLVKGDMPARYLVDNQTELFKSFHSKIELSNITFNKYLKESGVYKKPHR